MQTNAPVKDSKKLDVTRVKWASELLLKTIILHFENLPLVDWHISLTYGVLCHNFLDHCFTIIITYSYRWFPIGNLEISLLLLTITDIPDFSQVAQTYNILIELYCIIESSNIHDIMQQKWVFENQYISQFKSKNFKREINIYIPATLPHWPFTLQCYQVENFLNLALNICRVVKLTIILI